jgi:hypothetical protein
LQGKQAAASAASVPHPVVPSPRKRQADKALAQDTAHILHGAPSLMDTHARGQARRKLQGDDPLADDLAEGPASVGGFNRDRDMAVGAGKKKSLAERDRMIQDARQLNSKFGHGSSSFL